MFDESIMAEDDEEALSAYDFEPQDPAFGQEIGREPRITLEEAEPSPAFVRSEPAESTGSSWSSRSLLLPQEELQQYEVVGEDPGRAQSKFPITTDQYQKEAGELFESENFWELPYEEKVHQLRSVYLGADKKGKRNFEDDDEVLELHKSALNSLRDYDAVPVVKGKDYEELLGEPPPDVSKMTSNQAEKALDAWEASALSHARAKGGLFWKEIEDVATAQIKDYTDANIAQLASKEAFDDPTLTKSERARAGTAAIARGALGTFAGLLPESWGGEAAERSLRRSEIFAALPPEKKVVFHVPVLGDVGAEGMLENVGSGLSFMVGGTALSAVAPTRVAAAGMMSAGARLGYAEAYDEVLRATGDPEKATKAGLGNMPIQALDSLIDLGVVKGLFSPFGKIAKSEKIATLAKVIPDGWMGDALATGFKVAGNAGTAALVEGGTEALQELATGEIEAYFASDPTLRRTREQLSSAFLGGALTGGPFGAASSSSSAEGGPAGDIKPPGDGGMVVLDAVPEEPPEAPPPAPAAALAPERAVETPVSEKSPGEAPPPALQRAESEPAGETSPAGASPTDGTFRTLAGEEVPYRMMEIPLDKLVVQKDVPNFKAGVNPKTGVALGKEPQPGERWDPNSGGAVTVLEKDVTGNGEMEIISGRHRFAIAQGDPNKNSMMAVVIRESEGTNFEKAKSLDAQLNIRDDKGEVSDFARFFEKTSVPLERAKRSGLLRYQKGQQGYAIGTLGTDETRAAFNSGRLKAEPAAAIANSAPNDIALQRVGLKAMGLKGATAELAVGMMGVARRKRTSGEGGSEQGILFGEDEFRDSERLSETALEMLQEVKDALGTISTSKRLSKKDVSKIPGISGKIDLSDPEAVKGEQARLATRAALLAPDTWALHDDIAAEVEERTRAKPVKKGEQQLGLSLARPAAAAEPSPATPPPESVAIAEPDLFRGEGSRREALAEDVREARQDVQDARDDGAPLAKVAEASDRAAALELELAAEPTTPFPPEIAAPPAESISAAAASQFEKPSELFLKTLISQGVAETDAEAPFSREVFAELEAQNAGEYAATSFQEQNFLAEQFLEGKEPETLARDLLNPETPNPLVALPQITQSVVTAKVLDSLEQMERRAREAGKIPRADDLKALVAETYINYLQQGTGIAQALAVRRMNNDIMNILGTDKILAAVEAMHNEGRTALDPKVQQAIIQLSKEADQIGYRESELRALAAGIEGEQRNAKILQAAIEKRKAELRLAEKEFQLAEKELGKELKNLSKLRKKGDRAAEAAEKKRIELEAQLATLEKLITDTKQKLADAEKRYAASHAKLRSDIKSLNSARRQLEGDKKALTKKELKLRKRRSAARERLVFKTLPVEFQGKLKEMAKRLEEAPTGSGLRQEIVAEMIDLAMSAEGLTPLDKGMAIWYANALSGFSTQGINAYGSGLALAFRSLGYAARNVTQPRTFMDYMRGLIDGAGKGAVDFSAVMKHGRVARGNVDNKLFAGHRNSLEHLQKEAVLGIVFSSLSPQEKANKVRAVIKQEPAVEILTGFGIGKFMGRLLRATDAFWYRTAREGMMAAKMGQILRDTPNISDNEMARAVSDYMYRSTDLAKSAWAQAEGETRAALGERTKDVDIQRRVFEILEENLPESVLEEGDRWGSLNTFTNHPEGVFGAIVEGINGALSRVTIPTRWGDLPLAQPFFPFVNVVANVAETGLEFSPVGYLKALAPHAKNKRAEMVANATVGTLMASALFGLAGLFDDDDDPKIAIYGSGKPLPKERKDQLRQAGWRPFTIKIGNMFIPYKETPLYWLATMGAYFDNKRWNSKFDTKIGSERLQMMALGIGESFGDQATLRGLRDIFGLLGMGDTVDPVDTGASYLSNFLPAAGLARDLDRVFNGTYQEVIPSSEGNLASLSSKFVGSMFKNYPVIGESINKPLLNGFGEVISIPLEERFGMVRRTLGTFRRDDADPEWKFLAEHGLTFSGFKRTIEVTGGKSSGAKRVQKSREELVGRAYANIFTPEERYRYIELAGPRVKEAVGQVMARAGDKPREKLQEELDKAVSKAKKRAKLQFIREELAAGEQP